MCDCGGWGVSIQRQGENIYITTKGGKRKSDGAVGRVSVEGDLVLVRRGMCKGLKVETG